VSLENLKPYFKVGGCPLLGKFEGQKSYSQIRAVLCPELRRGG